MPYSPLVGLTFTRAEAVVLRAFLADSAMLAEAQKANPALALIIRDIIAQFEHELVEHHRPDYATVLQKMKEEVSELETIDLPKDIVLRLRRDFAKREHVHVVESVRTLRSSRLIRCAIHLSGGSMESLSKAVAVGLAEDRDLIMAAEYDRGPFHDRLYDFSRPFGEASVKK